MGFPVACWKRIKPALESEIHDLDKQLSTLTRLGIASVSIKKTIEQKIRTRYKVLEEIARISMIIDTSHQGKEDKQEKEYVKSSESSLAGSNPRSICNQSDSATDSSLSSVATNERSGESEDDFIVMIEEDGSETIVL